MQESVSKIISNLRPGSPEYKYIIRSLLEAVDYCHEQFRNGESVWLPPAADVGLQNEVDKFELLKAFLRSI